MKIKPKYTIMIIIIIKKLIEHYSVKSSMKIFNGDDNNANYKSSKFKTMNQQYMITKIMKKI